MFGGTYVREQLFSLMKSNKTNKIPRLMDMHLSSIMKAISAQDLKSEIRMLAANKWC
jgi:hypothetical protein